MIAPKSETKPTDRAARERAFIQAAAKLFASRGYEATTTREIARAAGCAEGLISRYFNGKAGLLLALIQLHIAEETEELNDTPPAATIDEEIRQLIEWELTHMGADRDFLKVMIPQLMVNPKLGEEVIRAGPVRRTNVMTERLRKYPEGQALPEDELRAMAEAIGCLGFIFGFMDPTARLEDPDRARQTALTIGRMLARSL